MKKKIRDKTILILNNIDKDKKRVQEKIIHEKLFSSPKYKKAKTIALTISMDIEVDTYEIIKRALKDNKTVCAPICNPKDKSMQFYKFFSINELKQGFYNIKTPPLKEENLVKKEDIDIIIVPGLAFDNNNYRIGFGGGYYDRYLKDYKGYTISLALKEQIIPNIPHSDYDIPINKVISSR